MFATLFTVALFVLPAIRGVAAFQMTTPTITQCGKTQLTWDATKEPYNLIIVPSNDPCGDVIADLGDSTTDSITWTANLLAGTQIMFSVEDGNGDEAWSGNVTVAASDDISCLSAADQKKAATSTSASALTPKTTLVVAAPSASASTTSSGSAVPVGAAAAGADPLGLTSGALSTLRLTTPALAIGAIAAFLATL